ncbi:MAG: hypothetical protein R3Y13_01345 [bacterium]
MERKNTMLLTVIAIATLLVAVVGATFAYFTAAGTLTAASTVTVATESLNSATSGAEALNMTIALADMLEANSTDNPVAVTKDVDLTIEASTGSGGGQFLCTYDLIYSPDADAYYTNTGAGLELSLSGAAAIDGDGTLTNTSFNEVSIAGSSDITLVSGAEFALDGIDQEGKLIWTVTANYYNRDYDQSAAAGTTYTGVIKFDVSCVVPTSND